MERQDVRLQVVKQVPIVVGFLGRIGAGKTTAANFLVERYNAERVSLARPLKDLAKVIFGFTEEQVRGTQAQKEAVDPRYGISPRTAMIRLGEGAREILGHRVWVDACLSTIVTSAFLSLFWRRSDFVVIDDVRHLNEVEAIRTDKRVRGIVLKLVSDTQLNPEYADAPSERSVDAVPDSAVDAVILSSRSQGIEVLRHKVLQAVLSAMGER